MALALRAELGDPALNGVKRDLVDVGVQVLAVENLVALLVDDLALSVHDVVVVEDVLTHGKVDFLNLALGALNGLGDHLCLNRHVVRHLVLGHHRRDAIHTVAAEQAHEVVLEREIELGLARIALTAGAASELVVDTTGLVALGADHAQAAGLLDALLLGGARRAGALKGLNVGLLDLVDLRGVELAAQKPREALGGNLGRIVGKKHLLDCLGVELEAEPAHFFASKLLGVAAKQDIGTTASHVRRDGNSALATRLGNDLRLTLVELGVEDVVLDSALGKNARELLGILDGDGTDQARLTLGVTLLDVGGNGSELCVDRAVHEIVMIHSLDRLIGRDHLNGDVIDLAELRVLGHGGTGHAGELVIHEEVVLESDGGERLVLLANDHAFLGLDGLVQALGVAPALHNAAGELIDNLDLAVDNNILLVAVEHVLRLQRLLKMVDELTRDVGIDVFDAQVRLDLLQAFVGGRDGVLGLIHLEVDVRRKTADGTSEVLISARGLGAGARDNKRGAGLIDKNGVCLVDDGVVVAALNSLVRSGDHVVAKIIEAKLGVRAVGDVGLIGGLLEVELHAVLDEADLHAQEAVDAAHPLRVALRKVIVDGNDVHALARDGVEIAGERGDKRLALAGLHLGNGPLVQGDAADNLNIEVAQARDATRGLPHRGKCLRKQVIKRLASLIALAEELCLASELLIRHGFELGLKVVNHLGDFLVFLELFIRANREQLGKEVGHMGSPSNLKRISLTIHLFHFNH